MQQKQLGLPLRLADFASFENFVVDTSAEAVAYLQNLQESSSQPGVCFLLGARGVGKTHLLHATARSFDHATDATQRTLFVAAGEQDADFKILNQAANANLVCVDNVHAVATDANWENALFSLIERAKNTKAQLLFTSLKPVVDCGFALKDLSSRLTAGQTFQLQGLDDPAKQRAIKLRAKARGFEIGDDVVQYIFNRLSRDTHSLFALLDRIDDESLSAGRKVTVPFVSELLKTYRLE